MIPLSFVLTKYRTMRLTASVCDCFGSAQNLAH
jgi:hypothetical protein